MIEIAVDPFNPGEVLACCGIFECAELLERGGRAQFSQDHRWKFRIHTEIDLQKVIGGLKKSEFKKAEDDPRRRFLAEEQERGLKGKGKSPLYIVMGGHKFLLDWWWLPTLTEESKWAKGMFKGWAGRQEPIEVLNNLLGEIQPTEGLLARRIKGEKNKKSLGFDARAGWTPRDLGYSADETRTPLYFSPAVEVFAFIGLQNFKPVKERGELEFKYFLWTQELPISLSRIAFNGAVGTEKLVGPFRAGIRSRGKGGETYKTLDFAVLE